MKRLTLLVTALLASAMMAQAKIGETRDQLIKRFWRNQIVSQTDDMIQFKGKNGIGIGLRNGISVFESYSMTTEFNSKEADEIIKTVLGVKQVPKFDKIGGGRFVSGIWEVLIMQGHVYERTGWSIVVGYRDAIDAAGQRTR